MKHYGEGLYISKSISKVFDTVEGNVEQEKNRNHKRSLFVNLFTTTDFTEEEIQELFESLSDVLKVEAMETYEKIILKWKTKGLEEGKAKVKEEAINGIIIAAYNEGIEETLIAKIAKLTLPELKERIKQLGIKRPS